MNTIFSYLSYLPRKTLFIITTLLLAGGLTAAAIAGFGPDRPTKVYNGPGTPGFDHVTFNSFTNVPKFGDEREFFNAQYPDKPETFYDPLTQLRQGDEILMHVYIHNGADPSLNESGVGVARNVRVKVDLPTSVAKSAQAKATITADNAQPKSVFDTVDFSAENSGFFGLDFVEGSARLVGNGRNEPVADTLVTNGAGVNIGDLEGCFEPAVAITFKVKVNMPRAEIAKDVRFDGQGPNDWKESVTAKRGDTVEWRISFKNTGATELKSVKIVDDVPPFMTVVPGSVRLKNGNYPNGYTFPDSAIQAGGKQINVDIGNYNPGINAFVYFKTKVQDANELKCGTHKLQNVAFATPEGFGSINDVADVIVENPPCEEQPPEQPPQVPGKPAEALPTTGPVDVIAGVFGTGALGVTLRGFLSSRRALRDSLLGE